MDAIIIIQARANSSRLPAKIFLDLNGKTVLQNVVERLKKVKFAQKIIVATTDNFYDDLTVELCEKIGVEYYRGSELNVLERYYHCAKKIGKPKNIVRATSDDPLTSISLLNTMYKEHINNKRDYTTTSGFPIGVQEEIVTFEALEKCYINSTKPEHFEHVLEYITDNPKFFNIGVIKATPKENREDIRVTLDTVLDYVNIYKIRQKIDDSFDNEEIICAWDKLNE